MAKVTLTFEDTEGDQVGMLVDLGEPFNKASRAHMMANGVLNYLDRLQAAGAPEMVRTAEQVNAARAATIAHIPAQQIIIAGG